MTARRFVIVELDQTRPDYGAQFALDPRNASAIPIPAFKAGPALPKVAEMNGEGFFNTTTNQAYVWNEGSWLPLSPAVIIAYPTDADVLADTKPGVGSIGAAGDTGNMYVKTPSGWKFLGIRSFPSVPDLQAANLADGSAGFVVDEGSIWMRVGGKWVCQTRRLFPTYAALRASWPAGSEGDMAHVVDENTDWTRVGDGDDWWCQSLRPMATEADRIAWVPGHKNERAWVTEDATEWVRVGPGDDWRCVSVRRLADHAALMAWNKGYNGERAILENEDSEWVRTDRTDKWRCVSVRPLPNYAALRAWNTGFEGERAYLIDEGTEWIRRDDANGWQCLDRRPLPDAAALQTWTAAEGFDGDSVWLQDEHTTWIRIGKTDTWKCLDPRGFADVLTLLNWGPGQAGELAYEAAEGSEWLRVDANRWKCLTMRGFTDFAELSTGWSQGVTGETAYLRSDGSEWVRMEDAGAKWRCTSQRSFDTYNDLTSQWATGYEGERAYLKDENSVWVRSDDANTWVCEGIRSVKTLADVVAWSPADGALANAADYEGGLLRRENGSWVPTGVWTVSTEAALLAETKMLPGQIAVAIDTGRSYTWSGTQWVGQPIRHYATEVELLAATPPDGTLAWADDTNHVYTRGGGNWLSTDLPPTGWAVDWKDEDWPKDSLVVVDGKIWRAKALVAKGSPTPAEPLWEKVGGGASWEALEVWEALADGTKKFTPDWTKYSSYIVELFARDAVFTKSATALVYTGVQTSHKVGGAAYSADHVAGTERQLCPNVWFARVRFEFDPHAVGLDLALHTEDSENIIVKASGPNGLTGEFAVRWVGAGTGRILGLSR